MYVVLSFFLLSFSQVVRDSSGYGTPVKITGSEDAIKTAKDLIDDTLSSMSGQRSNPRSSTGSEQFGQCTCMCMYVRT